MSTESRFPNSKGTRPISSVSAKRANCGSSVARVARAWRHVPRELCAECGSWEWEWQRSSGKGEVFSYTIVERALHPAFADSVPYAPAVVELEEGVRLLSEVTDVPPADLEIGMRVEVTFDAVTDEITLPRFVRAVD